ncbi:hypothetical protein SeMB42_g01491 [Synchytrium endobioticum]|uniref:Uncharacterized protein n=1 Tax=Synchytrium endobioticum TaxID=286115 RepID=A0A507DL21_9FUNG|nr:hypothetical protein SeLEV6574_g01965 [Synchytrium endobioticum]TPX52323.1 hypothetical protein SeMB42_g01491 [Synchytrium endobioticum]
MDEPFAVEEELLMPGVYLVRPATSRHQPNTATTTNTPRNENCIKGIEGSYELLAIEAARLRKSVKTLISSNQEMRDFDATDPDLQNAIAENVIVIDRQFQAIQVIEARMKELAGPSQCGRQVCPQPSASSQSAAATTSTTDDEGGLYL